MSPVDDRTRLGLLPEAPGGCRVWSSGRSRCSGRVEGDAAFKSTLGDLVVLYDVGMRRRHGIIQWFGTRTSIRKVEKHTLPLPSVVLASRSASPRARHCSDPSNDAHGFPLTGEGDRLNEPVPAASSLPVSRISLQRLSAGRCPSHLKKPLACRGLRCMVHFVPGQLREPLRAEKQWEHLPTPGQPPREACTRVPPAFRKKMNLSNLNPKAR